MNTKLLKLPEVIRLTALSRSSIYAHCSIGEFPKPITTGKRSVAWIEGEIHSWISEKIEQRKDSSLRSLNTLKQSNPDQE
jgi:prophage regulatory protein